MHWLRNSFGVIVAILLLIEVLMVFVVRNYYYTAAKEYVSSKMNIVSAAVQSNSEAGKANLNSRIRTYVESYEDKERIELMAINNDDEVEVGGQDFGLFEGLDGQEDVLTGLDGADIQDVAIRV